VLERETIWFKKNKFKILNQLIIFILSFKGLKREPTQGESMFLANQSKQGENTCINMGGKPKWQLSDHIKMVLCCLFFAKKPSIESFH